MVKKLPRLKTDVQAIAFVDHADLSEYDLTGFVPAREFFTTIDKAREDKAREYRPARRIAGRLKVAEAKATLRAAYGKSPNVKAASKAKIPVDKILSEKIATNTGKYTLTRTVKRRVAKPTVRKARSKIA